MTHFDELIGPRQCSRPLLAVFNLIEEKNNSHSDYFTFSILVKSNDLFIFDKLTNINAFIHMPSHPNLLNSIQ